MSTETTIGGYRLLNLMMTGQTSQVWEVVEGVSARHLAMKLLLPENTRSPEHLQYLFREGEVGLKLQHPKVIRIIKLIREKNNPFIIMEFFPSTNLKVRVVRKQPIVIEKAHSIIEQAAAGFAHINDKGWVHRDVKPDNILVNSVADVRVIDFALAQRINTGGGGWFGWFRKKKTQGTRSYMSPEQIKADALDARADVYSFGASIYELAAGRPPFRAASAGELLNKHLKEKPAPPTMFNPNVTKEFSDIVMRMLAKRKEERPKDLHEFGAYFRNIKVFLNEKVEKPEQ